MKRLLVLSAVFAGGVLYLFNRQFAAGGVYPEYSTLRSDPAGAKLIFESLRRLPGVTVARNYLPLDRVSDRDSTVIMLGVDRRRSRPALSRRIHKTRQSPGNCVRSRAGRGPALSARKGVGHPL